MKTNYPKELKAFRIGLLTKCFAVFSMSVCSLLAANSTWNGGATSNYWSAAANWGGTAVASGNALTFSGTTKQVNTNDLVGMNVGAITNSTAGWNVTGNAVTNISGIMVANVSGSSTWGLDTTLNTTATFSQSGTADILNLTGVLSGSGGIGKTAGSGGQGVVNLVNTNNSFTGQINIRSGTVGFNSMAPIGQNSALGSGGGSILVGYTGTSYAANLVYNGTNNCSTDHALSFANSGTTTISLNNNSPNNSSLTFYSATPVAFAGGSGVYFPLSLGGTSSGTNTFTSQFGAALWGGNLQISGPGTWAFSNVFNFTGNLSIAGTSHFILLYNSLFPSYSEIPAFAQITLSSGGTFDVSSYDQNGSVFVLGSGGISYPQTLIAGRTNGVPATDINGSLSLAGSGTATLKVAGANLPGTLTISSNFIPASGTIAMDLGTNTTVGLYTNDLILVGGNLDLSQGTAIVAATALKGAVNTNTAYTLISYTGSLIGSASGLSVSSPSRAYLPGVVSTATPGFVQVSFAPSGQTNANLVWKGNLGQNWDLDATANWLNGASGDYFFGGDNVTFNDSASQTTVNLVGTLSPGTIVVSNNINNYTLSSTGSGVIGGGSLTKQGIGSLTLSTPNTYASGTVISAGTVTAANNTALGSGSITLADANTGTNAASLQLAAATLANTITVSSFGTGVSSIGCPSSGTINGPIVLQRNVSFSNTTPNNTANTLLVSGGITGTGNVTVGGGGFHKWQTGACNFSGNISVVDLGTMLDINTVMNTNVNINLAPGTLLGDVNSPTINGLTGTGLVEPGPGLAGNSTLYFGAAGATGTFAGSFTTNSGGFFCNLVKAGSGTITFTGDNSLSAGVTTISNGTLVVNNSTGYGLGTGSVNVYANLVINNTGGYGSGNGIISVAPGGTLSGTGSVYSATHTLQVSGVLSVGNVGDTSGKTFTVTNSGITIATNGALNVDLFTGAGAGDNSATAAAADVLLAQTATVSLNAGSILNVGNPNNMTAWAVGDKWKIINWDVAPTGTFTTLNLPVLSSGLTWDTSQLYTSGTLAVIVGAPTQSAQILGVTLSNGNIIINGTNNNVPNTSFHFAVLTTTNLTAPLTNWTVLSTNGFNANGTFTFTNAVDPSMPAAFFDVEAVP